MTAKKKIIVFLIAIIILTSLLYLIRKPSSSQSQDETLARSGNASGETVPLDTFTAQNLIPSTEERKLSLLIPASLFTPAFKEFTLLFQQKYGVQVSLEKVDKLSDYFRVFQGEVPSLGRDIFLYPYDWVQSGSFDTFRFQENVLPYFVSGVQSFIHTPSATFLPFVQDPVVTFIRSGADILPDQISFSNLLTHIASQEGKSGGSIPVLRGATSGDYLILSGSKEPFEYYSLLRNILLSYFKSYSDANQLQSLVDVNTLRLFQSYSPERLQKTQNLIQSRLPLCKKSPGMCLLLLGFSDVRFGFLSDINLASLLFPEYSEKVDALSLAPFPTSKAFLPTRIRGFVVNKETSHPTSAYLFLQEYMEQVAIHGFDFQTHLLPVFKESFLSETESQRYKDFLSIPLSPLTTLWDQPSSLLRDTVFREMMLGSGSVRSYLLSK